MIKTKVFEIYSWSYKYPELLECIVLEVNGFIRNNDIKRADILEYRTETWEEENKINSNLSRRYYRVILTWWA